MGPVALLAVSFLVTLNGARLQGKAVALGKFSTGSWALMSLLFGGIGVGIALTLMSPV